MHDAQPQAEAISWRRGRIEQVGSSTDILSARRWYSRVRDLQGATVLPGFVDAHSHFPSNGLTQVTTNLAPPPLGQVDSLESLYSRLQDAVTHKPDDWLLGFNYDNASLSEGTHPTREGLDRVSTEQPIYAYHSSGHMGVGNTRALELLDASAEEFPQGLLQESDAPPLAKLLKTQGLMSLWRVFVSARDEYLANGITTANNGATPDGMLRVLKLLASTPLLPMRIVVNPLAATHAAATPSAATEHASNADKTSFNNIANTIKPHAGKRDTAQRFYRGAAKIIVDGSPQGFTAYLSKPFHARPPTGDAVVDTNYRGEPLYTLAELVDVIVDLNASGQQLALHGNGDAAIDLILDALEAAGMQEVEDHRSVLVHAQTARHDQVTRMQSLGVTPSFFVAHVFYWGEWHRERVLGADWAENLSPTGWASQQGLKFSLHSDAPVTPMRPFDLASYAMLRATQSDRVLGPAHRLTAMQALRALTLAAAWQAFLDDRIGSLQPGKFADLVIVSDNPLLASAGSIAAIEVMETVVGGRTVYRREP